MPSDPTDPPMTAENPQLRLNREHRRHQWQHADSSHQQPRQGDGKGYLTQPQRQYPIAADPPEVLERIARRHMPMRRTRITQRPRAKTVRTDFAGEPNRARLLKQAELAREARRQVTVENRIKDAQRRARLKHLDITREVLRDAQDARPRQGWRRGAAARGARSPPRRSA